MSFKMTKKCKKKSDINDADGIQEITGAHVCVTCKKKHMHFKMGVKNI